MLSTWKGSKQRARRSVHFFKLSGLTFRKTKVYFLFFCFLGLHVEWPWFLCSQAFQVDTWKGSEVCSFSFSLKWHLNSAGMKPSGVGGPVWGSSSCVFMLNESVISPAGRPDTLQLQHLAPKSPLFLGRKLQNEAVPCSTPGADCSRQGLSCEQVRCRSAASPTFLRLLTGDFTAIFGCRAYRSAPPLPSPPRRPYRVFLPRPCTTDQSESEMKICQKPTFCHAESFRSTVQKIGSGFFFSSVIYCVNSLFRR